MSAIKPSIARFIETVAFNEQGLVPAIAQDKASGDVLMVAWMNAQALQETLETKAVTYYSRSRKSLWRKGETSGQRQKLIEARMDCDSDCLLLFVEQKGVACHTGRRSCFYRRFTEEGLEEVPMERVDPESLYS